MTNAAIVAFGAVSALGEGVDAFSAGEVGEPARVAIHHDSLLEEAGLARPFCARSSVADAASSGPASDNPLGGSRSQTLLERALASCIDGLERAIPDWRSRRIGLSLGTSSGGMDAAEVWFSSRAPIDDATSVTYHGPAWAAVSKLANKGVRALSPAAIILGACASATFAIGLATRWLETESCDIVLAGGFDAISIFVAAGFEVLRATTAEVPPRPFRRGRDGMALGEGAAVLALTRPGLALSPFAYVRGFGATSDAVHLTAPDRTGSALAQAIRSALADANISGTEIDLVSAHATATPFNDAAETRALAAAVNVDPSRIFVQPFKAQIGHTLGAAGALESLACVDSIRRGILPAAAGEGEIDPGAAVCLLDRAQSNTVSHALKLSAAFGGANAALVLGSALGEERVRPQAACRLASLDQAGGCHGTRSRAASVWASHAVHVTEAYSLERLAEAIGWTVERLGRTDTLTRLSLTAVLQLRELGIPFSGAGIVVGEAFATVEINSDFSARVRERGGRNAEPRKFPYTSPNAAAGECSVAFSLKGPAFAVGGGLHAGAEAICVAHTLVDSGDAERMVVVCVDERGPVVDALLQMPPYVGWDIRQGAVALVIGQEKNSRGPGQRSRILRAQLGFRPGAEFVPAPAGHLALEPLARSTPPSLIEAYSPPGIWARIDLGPPRSAVRE